MITKRLRQKKQTASCFECIWIFIWEVNRLKNKREFKQDKGQLVTWLNVQKLLQARRTVLLNITSHKKNKRTKKKRQKCDVVMFFFVFVLSSAQKVTIWHFRTSVNRFREVIDSLSLSLVRPISLTLSLTRRSATLSQRGALPHTSRSLSLVRRSSSSAAVLKQEKWHLISDVCADQWCRRLTESVQWEILN